MTEQNEQPVASKSYSIRQVAVGLNKSEQYIRQLLLTEKLHGEKDESGKWMISEADLQQFEAEHPAEKSVAYIVFLTAAELEVFKSSFPTVTITKRFDSEKAKAYRSRKAG